MIMVQQYNKAFFISGKEHSDDFNSLMEQVVNYMDFYMHQINYFKSEVMLTYIFHPSECHQTAAVKKFPTVVNYFEIHSSCLNYLNTPFDAGIY